MAGQLTSMQESERTERATYALTTYYNYIKAWSVYLQQYGSGEDGIKAFIDAIQRNGAFKHVQGGASVSGELSSAYGRGQLTLKAMRCLPIEEHPEIALSANFWLPVQAYYAIHAVGLATMIALNMSPPQSHRSFRAAFSSLVNTYFPGPFCARCKGGPERKNFSFEKIGTSIDKVARQNQLANPTFVTEIEAFVGKSLSTTRQKFLEVRFDEKRDERKKKRLSLEERNECCRKEHPTSICDLIYRMRLRSNYDNPDMYLFAPKNVENATGHYRDLLYLTEVLIAGLDALVERRIGAQKMANLKSRFE